LSNKRRKIPALTLSGGKLSEFKEVKAFRIWLHGKEGNHGYMEFEPNKLPEAIRQRQKALRNENWLEVEPIIAVVYDEKFHRFREVVIDLKDCLLSCYISD